MTRGFGGRLAKVLAAIATAGLAATWVPGQVRDEQVTRADKREVARLTDKMTTVCMGRFLVDMPDEARLELARPRIDGFDISSFDEPEADFKARLGQREARLRSAPDQFGGNRNLESVRDVNTEPGFCVYRAWFRDPLTADQGEQIMMHARLPSHPDVEFMAIVAAGTKPAAQSLLERTTEAEAGLTPDEKGRISTLRAARRTIDRLTGDEVVTRVIEMNDAIGYTFWWEDDGTEGNGLVPHFVFKMYVGKGENGPVPSSLSQDAAMALWDKITSRIRLRPTEPPTPVAGGHKLPTPQPAADPTIMRRTAAARSSGA